MTKNCRNGLDSRLYSGIQRYATIEVVAGSNPLPIVVFRIHLGFSDKRFSLDLLCHRPPKRWLQTPNKLAAGGCTLIIAAPECWCNNTIKLLHRMKAVALAKVRYRPGIDQFIKKWRETIPCSVARANALNVHVVTKRILAHA